MEKVGSEVAHAATGLIGSVAACPSNSLSASARLFLSCERMEKVGSEVALWQVQARPFCVAGSYLHAKLPWHLGIVCRNCWGSGQKTQIFHNLRDPYPRPMLWRCKRSEEHTSELQSRGLISYAVFCLK